MEPEDLSVQDGRSSLANCNRKESVDNVRDKRDDSSFHEDFFTAQINFLNPSSNALEPERQLNIAKFRSEHSRDNADVEQDEAVNMMMVNNIFNPNDVKDTLSLERNAMEQIEHCSSVQTMKNEREHSGLDQIHVPVIIHSSSVREIKTKRQQDDLEQVPVVMHSSSVQEMKRKRENSSLEQNCEPVQVPMVIQYSSVRDIKNKIEHSVLEQNKLEQVSVPTVITDNVFSVNGVQKVNNDEEQFKMNTSELEAKINGETQMETILEHQLNNDRENQLKINREQRLDNNREHQQNKDREDQLNNDREDHSKTVREHPLKIDMEHRLETNIENASEETREKNVPETDTDSESESYPKREELILPRTESNVYEKQQLSPESDTDSKSQNHTTREELILPSNSYEKQQQLSHEISRNEKAPLPSESNRNEKSPLPSESNRNEKSPLPSESNRNEEQKLSPESDHYEKQLSPQSDHYEKQPLSPESNINGKQLSPESDHYEKQRLSLEHNINGKQLSPERDINEKEPLSPESIRNEKEILSTESISYEKQSLSTESFSNEKQTLSTQSISHEKQQRTPESIITEKQQLSHESNTDEKAIVEKAQLPPNLSIDEKGEDYDEDLQLSPDTNTDEKLQLSPESNCTSEHQRSFEDTESTHREIRIENTFHQEEEDDEEDEESNGEAENEEETHEEFPSIPTHIQPDTSGPVPTAETNNDLTTGEAEKISTITTTEDPKDDNGNTDEEQDKTCGHCKQTFSSYLGLFRHTCPNELIPKKKRKYNKTIRTCKTCQAQFKSLNNYRKHVLDCWRKHPPPKKTLEPDSQPTLFADYEIKTEPLEVDSDDTIMLEEENDVEQPNNNDKGVGDVLDDISHYSSHIINRDLIPKPKIIEVAIKKEFGPKKARGRPKSKVKPERLPLPETHCLVCGVRYKNLKHYNVHKKRKIPCQPPPYDCKTCHQVFMTSYNLFYHQTKGNCTPTVQVPAPLKRKRQNRPRKPKLSVEYIEHDDDEDSLFDFLKDDFEDPAATPIEEPTKIIEEPTKVIEEPTKPIAEPNEKPRPRVERRERPKPKSKKKLRQTDFAMELDYDKPPITEPENKKRMEEFQKEPTETQPEVKRKNVVQNEVAKSKPSNKVFAKSSPTKPRVTTKILSCGLCDSKFLFGHLRKRHYEKYHKGVSPIDKDDDEVIPAKKDRKYKRRLLSKESKSDTTEEQTSQVPERSEKLQSPIPPKEKQTTTSDSSQLQLTLRSVTAEPPTVSPPKADEKIDVSIYLTPNGYECPMCSNFFKFPCRLREHLDRKTPCKPLNTEELDELGGQEIVIPKPLIVRKIPGKGFKRLYQMEDESPEDTTPPKTRVESGTKTPSNEVKKTVKKVLDVASTNTEVAVKKKVLKATPSTQQTNKNSDGTQDNSAVKPEKVSKALCKICNKVFPSVPDCYEHCLKFHNGKNETDKVKNNKDTSKETVSLPVRKLTSPTEREKTEEKKLKITIKSIKKEEDSSAYDALVNCPICLKQFVIIKARNTHLKSAHKAFSEERVMKFLKDTYCKKCKEYFGTPKDKYKHVEDVHGETPKPLEPIFTSFRSPKNTCVYCDGDFPSKTHLNTHMLRCQMKKVKTSPRVLKIDANQETSPLSKDTGYKCTHCDIKFNSLTLYKAHANRFCPKRDEIKTIKSKDFKQELFGLDDIVFLTCEMCSAKFNKRLEFDIHVKELCPSRPSPTKPPGFGSPRLVTKPKPPPEETTVVSNPTAEVIRRTPTMKPYIKYPPNLVRPKTCDTCNITFPTLLHYASHKRRCKDVIDPNNPPPPKRPRPSKVRNNFVKRSDCLIAKKNKRLLGPVKTAKYNPRKSVKCNVCYKTFSEIFTLSRHMRTIHLSPDERTMFICILCNSKFQNPRKLTRHYQDCHPESLKFQCGKCNKRYATNTRCVQHIRKQHGAVTEEIKVKDLDDENQELVSTKDPVDKVEIPTTPTTTTITAKVSIEAGPEEPVLTADEIAQILTPPDAQKSQPTPKKVRTLIKTPSPKGDKTNEEDDNFYTILDDTPGRGLYCCDVCNVSTFTKINALRRHWKTKPHKENAEKHRAELKQRAAIKEKPGVLDSKGNYSGQKLSCSVCFKAFFSITAFVRHRLRHFNAQQMDLAEINIFNPYVCEICHKLFSHHQRVQTHLLWHMKTSKSSQASSKTDLVKLPETTERQPPGIPKIVEKIKVPQTLDKFNAKKTIGSRAPVKTSTLLEPTHYSCDQCSEVFLSKYLFSAHIRHTCPKRLNCPYCSVLFPNKKATLDHMEICKDKGELTCRFCFLKLESVNDLGWHEKGCVKVNDSQDGGHSNEDHVLQCFWCKLDICAVEGDYVQLHMNMHEDQDIKMSCRICDIAFADKTEIYEHMNELSHLGLLPNAKVNGGGDGGHSWNSLDPTEKNGDVSTVDTDNLGSDTIRCGSNDVKKVPKDIKPGVIYSPWLNDDNKRLRTKFAQLMYLLISDAELLSSLGWGSRAIDNVLKDILVYFGHMPRELYLTDNNDAASQEMEVLRSNIKLFLSVCIKDDLLVTDENETIDGLVTRILSVCTSNNENQ